MTLSYKMQLLKLLLLLLLLRLLLLLLLLLILLQSYLYGKLHHCISNHHLQLYGPLVGMSLKLYSRVSGIWQSGFHPEAPKQNLCESM